MADAQKTIDLIFNGVDKTGAATLSALNNAKTFTASLQNVTQPIADFTVGALKLEAGLLAAGLAMTTFAVKTAGEFDTSFREISTIADASAEDLAGFRNAIDEYAAGSTQSMDKIMGALSAAVGSGVKWSESLDLIATAEKLAVATRSDLDSTTKVLVSTLNSYGLEVKDAGDVSDLFFSIIDKGDIKMVDLANSFAKVAPIAKISGVSLEEVGAAIATLTASGIKPAESIEYLRGAISNIISPSSMARDLAAELGINFSAAGIKADGLQGLLVKVAAATGGSADKMKILFGDIGGFTAAATLAGPQAATFAQTLIGMADRAGKASAAFDIMKLSIENSSKIIGNSFDYMLRQIGTPLLDEFGGIANAIAGIFKALGTSVKDGALNDLLKYIEDQFGGIQAALEAVAKNLPAALAKADLSGFKGGIDAVAGAFKLLFNNIDITTVDGLRRAIELAGAAFLGLSKFTAGVIESFKPLFDTLVKAASQVGGLGTGFADALGNIGGAALQVNIFATALGGLVPWLEAIVGLIVAKQGVSLVGGVLTLSTALPALVGTMAAWTGGIAAGAAGIGLIMYALNDWKEATDRLKASQDQSVQVNKLSSDSLERFAQTTGITVKSLDEAIQLHKDGVVVWDEASKSYKKAGEAMDGSGTAARNTADEFRKSEIAYQNSTAAIDKTTESSKKLAAGQKDLATYAMQTVPVFDSLTGKIIGYEQRLVKSADGTISLGKATDKTADGLKKLADETKRASDNQEKWNQEVAKMDFAAKIKMIESATQIAVASIEADAKKTVAAFESINNTITVTTKSITEMFGIMAAPNAMDWSTYKNIQNQISTENKLRQDAFDLQKKLTEAQIDMMKAQTKALTNGEGLIKIDGAGLKPHLEAFMWEILKAIQIKVNKDGLKMLLGV